MKLRTKIMLPALMVAAGFNAHSSQIQDQKITTLFPEVDAFSYGEHQVVDIKSNISKFLAKEVESLTPKLTSIMSPHRLAVPLTSSLLQGTAAEKLRLASHYTRRLKGLTLSNDAIYQLRLADSSMFESWLEGVAPLVAFAPKGDDKTWLYVEAYDQNGNMHLLDAHRMPTRPVLIVEIDSKKSAREGLAIMRNIFTLNDLGSLPRNIEQASNVESLSTSNLQRIRLNDDEEPWISGSAEVYAIVTGVSPSRDKPVLDIVDMPYLDHDGRDYTPNQTLIHWNRYRWQAADVLLMEQDDNTNYQTLATTFLDIVTQAMRAIPDANVQGYAIIPQLTNQLIKAMPAHWFSNDDDYIDVFYTLFEGQHYDAHMGASGNAKVTIKPVTINPR
ncbi:DUF3103 family protein [Pseudoalteromonas sp. MMG013]|uniref:DUF3103 family protein n=1 Tax=Pseudoalteromonas sp. MMG013 TaxID=2822687 RepID=UPI001B3693EB|nr:DUF3103 family protein [Pseudoalteromonas sp. MMG013]MBQ4864562.1 DUF3103 family protein [Pseudoalteromonas sp. MMG013]